MICNVLATYLGQKYDVIGTVSDGRDLLTVAKKLLPDVVILDVSMPELNGISAGRELKKIMPRLKLIYLTMIKDSEVAIEAMNVGASAFLLKNSSSSELLTAIDNAQRGLTYITPEISRTLEARFNQNPKTPNKPSQLTDRQREVLQLLAEGHGMKQIAYTLGITHRTVRFHKYRTMEELGLSSDAELIQYAIRHRIIFTPETIQ